MVTVKRGQPFKHLTQYFPLVFLRSAANSAPWGGIFPMSSIRPTLQPASSLFRTTWMNAILKRWVSFFLFSIFIAALNQASIDIFGVIFREPAEVPQLLPRACSFPSAVSQLLPRASPSHALPPAPRSAFGLSHTRVLISQPRVRVRFERTHLKSHFSFFHVIFQPRGSPFSRESHLNGCLSSCIWIATIPNSGH